MADEKDVLLGLFKYYFDVGLYHQQQTNTTSNIVLALAAVIIGLVTYDEQLKGIDIIAAPTLFVLGLFGVLWSAKQHQLFDKYTDEAFSYRDELDKLLPETDIRALSTTAQTASAKKSRILYSLHLRYLWMLLNLLIAVVGILIAIIYFL
jgi:Ca2+/Na+ antiporter